MRGNDGFGGRCIALALWAIFFHGDPALIDAIIHYLYSHAKP